MRYLPSDKYNVAWFKLAECVSRGEKERALGVYRLLSHSFDDPAFSLQLKGDILSAFDDLEGAIDYYHQAIKLYEHEERLLESAAVCEHVLTMIPDKKECIERLINTYTTLHISSKVVSYLHVLFALFLGQNAYDDACKTLIKLDQLVPAEDTIELRRELVLTLLKKDPKAYDRVIDHVQKVIEGLMCSSDNKALQLFLSKLEVLSQDCYVSACEYMEETALKD